MLHYASTTGKKRYVKYTLTSLNVHSVGGTLKRTPTTENLSVRLKFLCVHSNLIHISRCLNKFDLK